MRYTRMVQAPTPITYEKVNIRATLTLPMASDLALSEPAASAGSRMTALECSRQSRLPLT